ncbi:DNA helicase [Mycolicibacterium cyprinidarum]|nr:DNA helicase [Mycolicibacterium sp. NGTWS1803]
MNNVNRHQLIGQTLTTLGGGLSPFIAQVLNRVVPPGTDWAQLLRAKDTQNGRGGGEYHSRDVALMLRAMTERLGELGYPFNRAMPRQAEIYAKELREVRNKWAHTGEFSDAEAYRAIDSAELLLRAIGAVEVAETVHKLKAAVAPAAAPASPQAQAAMSAPDPAHESAPDEPRISISAISDLSYAMAHCRIPVIDHITVNNTGGDRQGAVMEVDVVSAEGSHGGPAEIHLDLLAHQPTVLQNVDLKLDPASMWLVNEARPGDIRVVLRDSSGEVLVEAAKEVTVLAANQWKATPPQLALEILAAYIQPNAAAIAPLMIEVSDRLHTATGNSSIDGYQSENSERVDDIARAVFDAVKARDIRYAEPPASWGDIGQKVRTPAEVFDGRLGTCLDTTLALAAVLEQCGINSTIWLLRGHAFLGYWRIDGALDSVSTTEPVEVVNQVDLGNIGLIETTMVTQSRSEATFADARRAPRIQHLSDDLTNILGVTDVRQARRARIYPLPSRSTDTQGNVVVARYEPGSGPVIAPYVASETKPAPEADFVPARVRQWKNALLDLSLRNKLINYTDRAGYRLEVPGPALGRFEDAVNAGARISLLGSDEVQNVDVARGTRFGRDLPENERELLLADKHCAYIDVTAAAYKAKLRYLANKAKTIREETGANNLYLAFGMLSWNLNDRPLRSPLVLVPVSLSTSNRGERYLITIDDTGASTPNYCLIEKLRTALGLEIPALAQPDEDASGIDLVATFDAVRLAVAEAGLPFRVEDTVHLSILQFAKFPLWKDLDESWKGLSRNSLVRHLLESPQNPFIDPVTGDAATDLNELNAAVPVPADASQLRAVADAVGGRTFVLEGPPGTGKSQTITNLLAYAMAAGRRVLFVAEKRAALDVVKRRLESVGLGELSLDIHDKSARPAAVRAQIKNALELRLSHDADLLHTKVQIAESSRHSLARYAERLHEANAVGQSLYTARSFELAADQDIAPLNVPRSLIISADSTAFDDVAQVMRTLPEKFDDARPNPDHPWAFIDAVPPSGLDPNRIHAAAIAFDTALAELHSGGICLEVLGRCESPAFFDGWARLTNEPRYPLDAIDALSTAQWQGYVAGIEQVLASLASKPQWLHTMAPTTMDLDIPAIHAAAIAADESGIFGRKKRRRAVLAQLVDSLTVDPAEIKLKTLSALTADLQNSHAVVADLRQRVSTLPARLFDRPWNPFIEADVIYLAQELAALRRIGQVLSANPTAPHIADLRKFYGETAAEAAAAPLQALAAGWRQLTDTTGTTEPQQQAWAGATSFIEQWWATRDARRLESAVTIERWVALLQHIDPLLRANMDDTRRDILAGRIVAEDASLAFDRGVAVASVAERLAASGLSDFDVPAHDKAIERFTTSSSAIRDELRRSIPARLLEKRTFDSFTESGQIGLLKRQLDRKRGGMSVRSLMDNFGDLITQILPCTLMSPDSVARFFPAQADIFDIVVFDEASQIRVADAIGAMGRAKSVVVVGDSKQMPPTSFADTSASVEDGEDDTNPEVVADEESILSECVQSLVPQQWLSWHYRSQDEALIAFSNIHYYNGRLASFPAPLAPASGHGISLVRVDGQFERAGRGKMLRTNRVEAERIVADIRSRFAASPDDAPSIGVITFNAQQRDFIENLLRDAGDDRLVAALDEPDGLFVKNLENVQGDERDTILFSVAFSKKDNGVMPLNFGPLSKPGGERRLNVAITRARREVVLYSSFDPADLRAEETTQIGTKHLRAYLDMAHRGVDTVTQGGRRNAVIDRHRDDIAQALRDEGFVVKADVGLSDFRVDLVISDPEEPDQPLLAVLLDGQEWFGRRTVADRDGLPIEVLSKLLHWPGVERVWLPEWLGQRDATVARLKGAVAAAKQRKLEPRTEEVLTPRPVIQPVEESFAFRSAPAVSAAPRRHVNLTEFSPWNPVVIGSISVLDEIHNFYNRSRVVKIAEAIIDAEGPVHRDRLAKLVAGAFSLGKVSEGRRTAIQQVVPAEYSRADDRAFYWPRGVNPATWRTVRTSERGDGRPLSEVSLVEIGNAMLVVAEQAGGSAVDDLKRDALALFGGIRITRDVGARLDEGLERALAAGTLKQLPSGIVVVGSI